MRKSLKTQTNGHKPSEADALKALAEARQLREKACLAEINALLEKHNCQLIAVFQVGQQSIPVGKLVNLPHQVLIGSK